MAQFRPPARESQSDFQNFTIGITGQASMNLSQVNFGVADVANLVRNGAGDYTITLKTAFNRLFVTPVVRSDAGNLTAVIHDTGTTGQTIRVRIFATSTNTATDAKVDLLVKAKRSSMEF